MPKTKTKSAAKKRFKKVGGAAGSLIKRPKAYKRKKLTHKSRKCKRNLRKGAYVDAADSKRIACLLPY